MFFDISGLRQKNRSIVLSYKRMRQAIGLIGMTLPLVCFLAGWLFSAVPLQDSVSAYYYTNVRDVFVGILVCVGLFLLAYRGHERIDNIATSFAGLAGMGIAFFPCYIEGKAGPRSGVFAIDSHLSDVLHFVFAGLFFISLALISIFLFTLTDGNKAPTPQKKKRNRIYVASGVTMLVCLALFLLLRVAMGGERFDSSQLIFWIEVVMLGAFGVSWLTKGETILKD